MSPTDQTPDLLDRIQEDWARERPDLDTAAMGIVGRVLNLAGHFRPSAAQVLKPFGLHYSDLDVLATLRRSGVPYTLTPTELMQSVLLTSGAMTATLARLTKKSLVARLADERDGRIRAVSLTAEGRDLIDSTIALRFAEAETAIKGLSDRDRQALAALLRKLTLSLDEPG